MLTGKQRSALKKLAHDITPTVFIGKSGLTENIKRELEIGFETRDGSELDPKAVANQLADELAAEFVQAIGRKFTLYRESKDNKVIEI